MVLILLVMFGISAALVFPTISEAQSEQKTFVTHTGGVITTTGEVIDPIYVESTMEFDPMKYLREFNYGKVSQLPDGTTLREFTIIAEDDKIMEVSPGSKEHTMHFHGIHPAEMDGVFEIVGSGGGKFTYEFEAGPVGVHPYHCHVMPLEEHIVHGLYGVYIVDPKEGREPADEMVMVLNGLDTDFDTENNFYAANTIPFYYQHHPIQIDTNELIRVYVVNMVEFDPINNLHLHGNLYHYYPTGTDSVPSFYTDMITLSQTERGIMEFEYIYPGKYLFHAHKVEFSEKGWVGIFLVKDNPTQESPPGENYGN